MPSKISNKLYFSLCIETKKSKQPICSCLLLNVLFENYSMQDISNARFIQCKIYSMQDIFNARYIQCKIYPVRGISNVRRILCEVYLCELVDLCYPKMRIHSASKLGVKNWVPMRWCSSCMVKKRPPSSSLEGAGATVVIVRNTYTNSRSTSDW